MVEFSFCRKKARNQKSGFFEQNLTQGQLSIPPKERRLVFLALSSVPGVGRVCLSLPFSVPLSLHQHEVQDALVEDGVLMLQGAVNDIEVRECARDVEKWVKLVFPERPLHREDRPQALETPEVTLDDHASPPGVAVLTADEDRRDVSLGASVAQIRQESPLAQDLAELPRVRPQNCDIMNAARE